MKFIIHILFSAVAIMIAAHFVNGVTVPSFWVALLAALVLGVINTIIKPILLILTLPINILTLGLFSLVINAIIILVVAALVPGFAVAGFLTALIFAVVLSIINIVFGLFGAR